MNSATLRRHLSQIGAIGLSLSFLAACDSNQTETGAAAGGESTVTDTPEAQALMEYLATPTPHEIWASLGGFISPHEAVGLDVYPDEVTRQQAEILADAEIVRFDASDMMPGVVGTGTFWSGIIDYVGGEDVERVLADIEASWPE